MTRVGYRLEQTAPSAIPIRCGASNMSIGNGASRCVTSGLKITSVPTKNFHFVMTKGLTRQKPKNCPIIRIFGATDILMHPIVEQIKNQLPKSSEAYVVGNRYDIGPTNLVRIERRSGQLEKSLKNYKCSNGTLT